ncbi:MAG: ArnT family glycosyltransferase [Desulfatibacillaceae bacterium]
MDNGVLKPKGKSAALLALLVLVCAVSLRLAYVAETRVVNPVVLDALDYVAYGYNMATHGVYSKQTGTADPTPDSFRSPGFPALIAGSIMIFGENGFYKPILFVHVLYGAATALLAFLLTRLFLPLWGAFLAGMLTALSPHLVAMSSYLLTETQFAFFLCLGVYLFALAQVRRSAPGYAAAGAALGAAYLTNETTLLLPFALAGGALVFRSARGFIADKKGLALFLAVFVIAPVAWGLRNAVNVPPGAPAGSERALATMAHGAYPDFTHKDPAMRGLPYRDDPEYSRMSESAGSFLDVLWERVAREPGRYARWYLVGKPCTLWSWDIIQGQGDVYVYPVNRPLFRTRAWAGTVHGVMRVLHPVVLALSLVGLLLCVVEAWKRPRRGGDGLFPVAVYVVVVYYTLVTMVFAPWPRYGVPLRPYLYIGAVWCIAWIAGRLILAKRKGRKQIGEAMAA